MQQSIQKHRGKSMWANGPACSDGSYLQPPDCSGLVSVTAPVTAAGTQTSYLWKSRENYQHARDLCYWTATASLGIYSAQPQAVPPPDQDFVLPAETPVSAPGSIFHHTGAILPAYCSSCPLKRDGPIDLCLQPGFAIAA